MRGKLLLWVLIVFLLVGTVSAGKVLFKDDFELTNQGQWTSYTGTRTTDQASPFEGGTYSYHINNGIYTVLANNTMGVTGDINLIFDIYVGTGGSADNLEMLLLDSGCTHTGDTVVSMAVTSDVFQLYDGDSWILPTNSKVSGVWKNINITYYNIDDSCDVRITNDTSSVNTNLADCRAHGGSEPLTCLEIGELAVTPTTYLDNIMVCDGSCPTGFTPSPPPTITQTSPANNTGIITPTTVYFNVTAWSVAGTKLNITLWFNNSANKTWVNAANNTLQTWNISFDGAHEASYNWWFSVNDTNGQTNSTDKTLTVDLVIPGIVNNFVNGSLYYKNNLTSWFNFSDGLMLHRYNISIDGLEFKVMVVLELACLTYYLIMTLQAW